MSPLHFAGSQETVAFFFLWSQWFYILRRDPWDDSSIYLTHTETKRKSYQWGGSSLFLPVKKIVDSSYLSRINMVHFNLCDLFVYHRWGDFFLNQHPQIGRSSPCPVLKFPMNTPRWWFQISFIFTPIWGRFSIWLIFFKGVETTNQINMRHFNLFDVCLSQMGGKKLTKTSTNW